MPQVYIDTLLPSPVVPAGTELLVTGHVLFADKEERPGPGARMMLVFKLGADTTVCSEIISCGCTPPHVKLHRVSADRWNWGVTGGVQDGKVRLPDTLTPGATFLVYASYFDFIPDTVSCIEPAPGRLAVTHSSVMTVGAPPPPPPPAVSRATC